MMQNEWKLPLNFAVGFHVLIMLAALYLPNILDNKPKYEDIYTVDLINLAEQSLPRSPSEVVPPQPEVAPQEIIPKDAVSIADPAPAPPVAQPRAISIKPLKRKLKKKVPPPTDTVTRKKDLDQLKRQNLAEAIRAEQKAIEEARIAAEEAAIEKKLIEAARSPKERSATSPSSSKSNQAQRSIQLSALENQYYASIIARLQAYWSLPEFKVWDSSLEAIVIITINRNGEIADNFFEKRSGDRVFDQFVSKTLQDAKSLPPIPPALKKQRQEFGLRFSPEGIQ